MKHDPKNHDYTFKPFHYAFEPVVGATLRTNTLAKTAKDGQPPHYASSLEQFLEFFYC